MTRVMKWLLPVVALLLSPLFGLEAQANTITAASCSVSDVQTAIKAASDGDTVVIPNGSCSWTSGITISKQITLQGQSIGGVTITDTAGPATLLTFTTGNNFHTTIANIRFMAGTGTGIYLALAGSGTKVPLMHDMYFDVPDFQLERAITWFA